jgi:hypothetical protein
MRLFLLAILLYQLLFVTDTGNSSADTTVYLPFIAKQCGNCYYVDSILGSDSNPGSYDRPWKSLKPVEATRFSAGSSIYFKRGSSWTGGLTIYRSGTQSSPILFSTYGTGNRPVISNPGDGDSLTSAITVFADWVIIEGIKVQDAVDSGIKILEESQHTVIRDIEATNVGIGISIYSQHNLVTNNYIHDVKMIRNTPGGADDYGAQGVLINNSYNEISHNRLERCIGKSYDYGTDGSAFEFYSNADGNSIHHNWAAESDVFLEAGRGSLKNNTIAYNVSLNNRRFSTLQLTGSNVANLRVENNTIIENQLSGANDWIIFYFKGTPNQQIFLLRNNILYLDGRFVVSNQTAFLHAHNLYYLANGAQISYTLGQEEKRGNPLFTSLAGNDFSLQSSSPAINAGIDLGYTIDYQGSAVPYGPAPDIGAFEWQPD